MSRPAIMFVSQFAEPGSYNKDAWRRVLGQDDECPSIEALLDAGGLLASSDYIPIRAHHGEALPGDLSGVRAIILGGSYASVSDGYPWQRRILSWLGKIRDSSIPVLGICGGHQLMATALGGLVEKTPTGPEVGSLPIELTAEGARHPLFEGLPSGSRFYFANSERVIDTGRDAVILASRPNLPHAALDHGRGWVSVQFHPEATCDRMATSWLDIDEKRAAEYTFIPGCERVVLNFLKNAGLG